MQEPQEQLAEIDQTLTGLIRKSQEDCEECDEVLSTCCQSHVELIPGSLPLEAKCKKCGSFFKLRDLLKSA